VPVLEVSYPYMPEADQFALGRRLAPLRTEGVLFIGSGGMTHNLASAGLEAAPVPAWSKEFDSWAAETVRAEQVDALLDWRKKAPAAEIAHPDDGGHYRVFLFALGVALGDTRRGTRAANVSFPVTGFESTLSKRCVELA